MSVLGQSLERYLASYIEAVRYVRDPANKADNIATLMAKLTLPRNVANVCNWTHMCEAVPNIHANDVGHQKLAAKFESQLRGVLHRYRHRSH